MFSSRLLMFNPGMGRRLLSSATDAVKKAEKVVPSNRRLTKAKRPLIIKQSQKNADLEGLALRSGMDWRVMAST
jgi:hypothetical protein